MNRNLFYFIAPWNLNTSDNLQNFYIEIFEYNFRAKLMSRFQLIFCQFSREGTWLRERGPLFKENLEEREGKGGREGGAR